MSQAEKLFSLFAVFYLVTTAALLFWVPVTRSLIVLLSLAFAGVFINVGLLVVVFRDIFSRRFEPESKKFLWIIIILLFLPAVVVYLPLHGFRPR